MVSPRTCPVVVAARWVGLVTPISNRLAVPLVEGVVQPVVADTTRARELFPGIEPIPYREAVARALDRYEKNVVETRWSGALGHRGGFELADQEGLIREVRSIDVAASAREVFTVCVRIGGDRGYPAWGWAWAARGLLDKLVGGPGLRRGRRHPTELLPGEALDFWRVEHIDPPQVLRLRAEMKVPGRAWLQFETGAADAGHTRLTQTALFEPKGLLGVLYWYLLYPVHWLIFMSTVRELARQARAEAAAGSGAASVAGSAAR